MRKYFLRIMAIVAITGLWHTGAMAQQNNDDNKKESDRSKLDNNDEIIIRKKGDKDTRVTVEIKGGEVMINGKPLSEFDDSNVVVRKRKSQPYSREMGPQASPFRGGNWNFNYDTDADIFTSGANRPFLGVLTEKDDDGVKVSGVTKGSAAEKAGLKENDIITKVNETAVGSPEDLTKAIGKFKPQDKAVISFKRDKKEQKATVVLGKRDDPDTIYRKKNIDVNKDFNYEFDQMVRPRIEALNAARASNPRLGIKAQDTEAGKGVKVLDVEDDSNAEKAGIKEGDIITVFDGKIVNGAMELADAARNAKDKSSIKVKLSRSGKAMDLEIKIPKKLRTANL